MPVDRFEEYCGSMMRIEAGERRNYLVDLATAIGGTLTGKGLKEAVKALTDEAEGIRKK